MANSNIIYTVVARSSLILAEYTSQSGTFTEITRRLLNNINFQENEKMTYVYDDYCFHYSMKYGLIFLCLSGKNFDRSTSFAFLNDISNRWYSTYKNQGQTAPALGMNSDFSGTLRNQMEYYNSNPSEDRIKSMNREIDDIIDVMQQNIGNVIERGNKLTILVDKTDKLDTNANQFRKSSNKLKWYMITKNIKLTVMLICILLLVAYFIAAAVCGGLWFQGCYD
eukprot:TRINITY_DN13782_c0_g1_i1.p1 TRINITY_DN13782_c0_g1~~TRINITY_DN13782_c0_g1_i1.p1  ORF type:complete len:224 (-),score=45.39 TRINITY_DN13782_c0_g1_i1:160-831(-)